MRTRILVAAAVLCSTLPFWGGAVEARGLTFEERVRAFVDFLAERFAGVPYWDRWMDDNRHPAP